MAYVGVLLVIVLIASLLAVDKAGDVQAEGVNSHAKRIATQLATEINIAVEVGGGYMRTFVLPTRLENNIAYTLNVSEQRVLVSWSDRSYSLPVLASNITGLPVNGTNVIRNVNGVIVFG